MTGWLTESEAPLLTFYDDATGERTELSARALGRWASRAAAMLHDGYGLGPGDRAAVLLPPHWRTAVVLLGAWGAGLSLQFRLWATAGLGTPPEPVEAVVVSGTRLGSWLDEVPPAEHRFVVGSATPDYRNFFAELERYPASDEPARPGYEATDDGTTYREWGNLARSLADELAVRCGDRLLIDAAVHEHPVTWLLMPLSVGASIVLCANLDAATVSERVSAEGVTRVL